MGHVLKQGVARRVFTLAMVAVVGYYAATLAWTVREVLLEKMEQQYSSLCSPGFYDCADLAHAEKTSAGIGVMLEVHPVDVVEGSDCWTAFSATGKVRLGGFVFRRDGEDVIVGRAVRVRVWEQRRVTKVISFWNPWRVKIGTLHLWNSGIVPHASCSSTETSIEIGPFLVVEGSLEFFYLPNYVGILFLVIVIGLFLYRLIAGHRAARSSASP